jgi:hypothetical protein
MSTKPGPDSSEHVDAEPDPGLGHDHGGGPDHGAGDDHGAHEHGAGDGAPPGAEGAGFAAGHGSLSEEALRLAETLQAWLSSGAAMTGAGTASECKVCPICQLIGVVNGLRPEVLGHLTEAGVALVSALRAAMDSSERMWTRSKRPPVQHINVT